MCLCFAYVTYAEQDFWKFVEVHRGMYQFSEVEEPPLDKTRTTEVLRAASELTLRRFWTPARGTETGGTVGGAAVMRNVRGIGNALEACPGQAHVLSAEHPFELLVPDILWFEPVVATLTMVYLADGDVLCSRNAMEHADLAPMVRQMSTLWNFAGDGDVIQGVIAGFAWPRDVGRVLDTPHGMAQSCPAGKWNLNALAVMRPDLAPLVHFVELVFGVPWKPRAGMHLIDRVPAVTLPLRKARFRETAEALPWKGKGIDKQSFNYPAKVDVAERLAYRYGVFAGAIERHLTGQGGQEGTAPAQAKQCSRAVGPRLTWTDARARDVFTGNLPGCAADPAVRWLGQLATASCLWCKATGVVSPKHVVWCALRRFASQRPDFSREVTVVGPGPEEWKHWQQAPERHERLHVHRWQAHAILASPRARSITRHEGTKAFVKFVTRARTDHQSRIPFAWTKAPLKPLAMSVRSPWLAYTATLPQFFVRAENLSPPQPGPWTYHEGRQWWFPDAYIESPARLQRWSRQVRKNQWRRASDQWLAGGSVNGACAESLRPFLRRLQRRNKPCEAQRDLCIACGGKWIGARTQAAGLSHDDRSQLGGNRYDYAHRVGGGCPVVVTARPPEVQCTRDLEATATVRLHRHPCLWLKGLAPQHLMPVIPQPPTHAVLQAIGRSSLTHSSLVTLMGLSASTCCSRLIWLSRSLWQSRRHHRRIHVSRIRAGELSHLFPQRNEVVSMDRSGSLRAAKFLSVPNYTHIVGCLHSLGQGILAILHVPPMNWLWVGGQLRGSICTRCGAARRSAWFAARGEFPVRSNYLARRWYFSNSSGATIYGCRRRIHLRWNGHGDQHDDRICDADGLQSGMVLPRGGH